MAAALGHISYYVFYSLVTMELFIVHGSSSDLPCSQNCTCTSDATDCSHRKLTDIPKDLPDRTVYLERLYYFVLSVRHLDVSGPRWPSFLTADIKVRAASVDMSERGIFRDGSMRN
ncbi:leucine-rich repeats and immunoglobulin-like domains protein 1 isoform X1 [Tachysurus ichikawai]